MNEQLQNKSLNSICSRVLRICSISKKISVLNPFLTAHNERMYMELEVPHCYMLSAKGQRL